MKKIIFLSLAVSVVILFGINQSSSAKKNVANVNSMAMIHYQVVVHPTHDLIVSTCPILLAITDGNGYVIGTTQVYHSDQNTYNFYESGVQYGARAALLSNMNGNITDNICIVVDVRNSKTGTFIPGSTYGYDLWVDKKAEIDPRNNTNSQ
jgi:hypothetical protein